MNGFYLYVIVSASVIAVLIIVAALALLPGRRRIGGVRHGRR